MRLNVLLLDQLSNFEQCLCGRLADLNILVYDEFECVWDKRVEELTVPCLCVGRILNVRTNERNWRTHTIHTQACSHEEAHNECENLQVMRRRLKMANETSRKKVASGKSCSANTCLTAGSVSDTKLVSSGSSLLTEASYPASTAVSYTSLTSTSLHWKQHQAIVVQSVQSALVWL